MTTRSDETTSLLSRAKNEDDHGSTRRSRLGSFSRFGSDDEVGNIGVRPSGASISTVPLALEGWHNRSLSAQADSSDDVVRSHRRAATAVDKLSMSGSAGGGLGHHQRARSFMEAPDGSISALTPLEMGRHELYEELPFLAVPGMQRKEHNLSVAFSSYAAALDTLETDEYLESTTGMGLNPEEKELRTSQMSLILLDELEVDAITVTTPLIFAVLIASLSQFNFGYNISVMNAPEEFVFPGHSTGAWSAAVAAFCVGGPIGAVLAGKWADERGRRGALLLSTWIFIIGGLVQSLAPSLILVTVARAIVGVASGASTVLVPIYLGELAPPNLRGVMGTMTQFACVLGIFFADIVGFFLANPAGWRWMFFVISALAMVQLTMAPLLLESPRWLLGKNPDSPKARFIIKKLRGFRYDEEVETEVELYLGASKSQSSDGDGDDDSQQGSGKSAMAQMFADKNVRLLVVSTFVLQMAQQLSGINAVFFYSGLFFEGVIDNPLVGTTLIGGVNVLATYVALLLMDRCGRRTLIMWSSGGMFLSCVVIVSALLGYFSKLVALGAVAVYVVFFAIGLGPIPFLIVAEMFDGKYVAAAMSISGLVNGICNFFVGLFFPGMNEALGAYSFAPFGIVLLLTFLYAWLVLPETAGTTPEELQAKLVAKNAGVTYHNLDIEGMASHVPPSMDEWDDALAAMADEEGL
mmetsp:Transcript_39112/g.84338  ORF Transcript_39112/g.84338 Transcript_39112/m.84338 type:complete len:695 (+) Transcript_39112:137-2221(+)